MFIDKNAQSRRLTLKYVMEFSNCSRKIRYVVHILNVLDPDMAELFPGQKN